MRGDPGKRSFRTITREDLLRLAALALLDRHSFFERYPEWRRQYADRFRGSALCQGAALHYPCLRLRYSNLAYDGRHIDRVPSYGGEEANDESRVLHAGRFRFKPITYP
jgi:hypothetical protein